MLEWITALTGATSATPGAHIQTLWSGYGEIFRVHLEGATTDSVVVKHVRPPTATNHPRGWNTSRSHERKLRSYEVEAHFYEHFAPRCGPACRVPTCVGVQSDETGWTFALEDVDAAGFAGRRDDLGDRGLDACLRWLAHFHATFLGATPDGLWETGTYWHLATRPDELEATKDGALKEAAEQIDRRLSQARYRTFVHGDAKIANFCFSEDDSEVAAVDFQYVGGGCGMKDVAYFFSSCLTSRECERRADDLLDVYFEHLGAALRERDFVEFDALEAEWRALYPFAWADFLRFLAGWSPGHWKIDRYSERLTAIALDRLR